MRLRRSLATLVRVIGDDSRLVAEKGAPRGWYFRSYYAGRWAVRRGALPALTEVRLSVGKRQVLLTLSPAYLSAFTELFVDDAYDCRRRLGRPPRRILDLGANIGMASAYLHALYPAAEFLCVEPDPRNLPLLAKNISQNGLNARIADCAVGPDTRPTQLRFGVDPTCSVVDLSPLYSHTDNLSVRMERVRDLLNGAGWGSVDLVKIDIEGAEDCLLAENNGWLDRIGAIVIEIHPNTTPERIRSFLQPFGFTLERLSAGRELVYIANRVSAQSA
jgi:FkbM family methyltransferase